MQVTEGEETRTADRRALWHAVAVAAAVLAWWLLRNHEPAQRAVGAVFPFAVVLYVSEALPLAVTALLSVVLLVLLGGATPDSAFAAFGDKVILLFIGSFILAKGMERTGLDIRLSYLILRAPAFSRTAGRLLLTLGSLACAFSFFVSNTAVAAMMMPIAVSLIHRFHLKRGDAFATALPLMLAWGASASVGVMIATPPNLIAVSLIRERLNTDISFVQWSLFAMPISVLMILATWIVIQLLFGGRPPHTQEAVTLAQKELRALGPLSQGERNVLIAFLLTLLLWIAPDVASALLGSEHVLAAWLKERMHASVAALIGACALFVLPCHNSEGSRALTWRDAAGIDWGTILLFGGGIALGKAMFDSGFAQLMGGRIVDTVGVSTLWGAVALCAALAALLSELSSNTASATTMVPLAIGIAESLGVNPVPPALAAALGSSLGFMLPISTPPNAIAYGTGMVRVKDMAKAGVLLDIAGFLAILLALRLMLPLLGMA